MAHKPNIFLQFAAFFVSPLAEKNPVKALASVSPINLSMARVAVAVFTGVTAFRLVQPAAIGWPEATLAIGCIFAMPVLKALDKVSPQEVVAFGAKIIDRFGVGDVAPPHPGMDKHEDGP